MAFSHTKSVFDSVVSNRLQGHKPHSIKAGVTADIEANAKAAARTGGLSLSEFGAGKFEITLISLFAALTLVGLLRHELWRDEVQAWLLAINSPTLLDLFRNMRTEGHPGLWHLCLHGLSHLSRHPLTMQLFHLLIATANVSLIALFSPFTRLQKVLLSFGYFTFFEYALISRSYGLGLFFVLLFCCLYPRYLRRKNLLPFIALSLLSNASLHGLLLSVALSIPLFWPSSPRQSWQSHRAVKRRAFAWGAPVLLTSWLVSFAQIIRAAPGNSALSFSQTLSENERWTTVVRPFMRSIALVWRSYVPIPKVWGDRVWGENILTDIRYTPSYEGISVVLLASFTLSLLLIAIAVILLWSRPKLLAAYSVGTLLLLAFSHYVFLGSIRHHGHLFVLLVACLWLAKAEPAYSPPDLFRRRSLHSSFFKLPLSTLSSLLWKLHKPFFTLLLLCQFLGGSALYSIDLMHPFSASRETADFLRSQQLDSYPILGYDDRSTSTLSAYLDQPIYYPNQGQFSSFWETIAVITPAEATREIVSFVSARSQPVVLVLSFPLDETLPDFSSAENISSTQASPIQIAPLAHIESRIVREESFYLYLAQSDPGSNSETNPEFSRARDESAALMAQ